MFAEGKAVHPATSGHLAVGSGGSGPRMAVAGRPEVACTGGLLKVGESLLSFLCDELAHDAPHARPIAPQGDPLHGSARLAAALAAGDAIWPEDPRLLRVSGASERAT